MIEFDKLLQEWHKNQSDLETLQTRQNTLADAISVAFAEKVTQDKLLSSLPWQIADFHSRGANLQCKKIYKCEAVMAFLESIEWDNRRFDWHHCLKMGDQIVMLDDGEMNIHFSSVDDLIAFCQEQSITPGIGDLKTAHDVAEENLSRLSTLLEAFNENSAEGNADTDPV